MSKNILILAPKLNHNRVIFAVHLLCTCCALAVHIVCINSTVNAQQYKGKWSMNITRVWINVGRIKGEAILVRGMFKEGRIMREKYRVD